MTAHPDADQARAAAAAARSIVADVASVLPTVGLSAPTPAHAAAVQMVVGPPDEVRTCPHLREREWQPVVAFGREPGAVRCVACAFLVPPDPGRACDLCRAPGPQNRVILAAGNVVAVLDVDEGCWAALAGEEDGDGG